MPRAKIQVDLPESAWLAGVSRTFSAATFRIVTVLAGEETGIALVHVRSDSPMPILAAIQDHDAVVNADLFWAESDEALVQVETTSPPLLTPLWRAGVPVELPFDVVEGTASWAVTTSQQRLTAFRKALDTTNIQYEVTQVSELTDGDTDSVLTDRQRDVLETAHAHGYYNTPRDVTLTDVASTLGVSKSNCSELLHRAEGHIVDWFIEEQHAKATPLDA